MKKSPIKSWIDNAVRCGVCGTQGIGNCDCHDENLNVHPFLKSQAWRDAHPFALDEWKKRPSVR